MVEALGWKDRADLKKVVQATKGSRMVPLGDPLNDF
jgi:hypothetical protein